MRGWREQLLGCGLVVELTTIVVVATLVPLGIGIYLDRLLHTSPLLTLLMMILGITAGTVSVYRHVAREYKRVGGNRQ